MRKLTIDLNDLVVESFATTPERGRHADLFETMLPCPDDTGDPGGGSLVYTDCRNQTCGGDCVVQ
jgi:hypothetical protein